VGATGEFILFAVTDRSRCAENLPYGPSSITEASSPYVSTLHKHMLHWEWWQSLSLGTAGTVEIQWQFSDTKSLADRFQAAVSRGEAVTWTISYRGATHVKRGTWRFSDGAGNMVAKFAGSSSSGFSGDDGLWGGGTGQVDGDDSLPSDFWGHGVYSSYDSGGCSQVYLGAGQTGTTVGKNLMYFGSLAAPPPPISLQPSADIAHHHLREHQALFYGTDTASASFYGLDTGTGASTDVAAPGAACPPPGASPWC
jgi:hypothetical protein